jgi:hypothetical protein
MEQKTEKKHSELGIASFIAIIGLDILIIALRQIIVNDNTYMYGLPPSETLTTARHLWSLSKVGILIALGLGIAGLLQKNRKKKYAKLGTIISASTIILLLVGYVMLLLFYGVW